MQLSSARGERQKRSASMEGTSLRIQARTRGPRARSGGAALDPPAALAACVLFSPGAWICLRTQVAGSFHFSAGSCIPVVQPAGPREPAESDEVTRCPHLCVARTGSLPGQGLDRAVASRRQGHPGVIRWRAGGVYCRPVDIARQSSGLDAGSSGVAAAVSRGKGAGRPLIVRNPTPSPDRHDIRRRASVDPHGGI